jgi:hypothetical protein
MKTQVLLWLSLSLWSSTAQTNLAPFQGRWFAPPQLTLRPPESGTKPDLGLPAFSRDPGSLLPEPFQLSGSDSLLPEPAAVNLVGLFSAAGGSMSDFDLQIYERLQRQGCFAKAQQSESRIERAVDSIFRPEVMYIRKVSISCSVVTAFKRRNPLCLINPCVLQVSW